LATGGYTTRTTKAFSRRRSPPAGLVWLVAVLVWWLTTIWLGAVATTAIFAVLLLLVLAMWARNKRHDTVPPGDNQRHSATDP
jgi:Flp pilus assembly protein TadB